MDQENELAKMKFLLVAVVFFLISCFYTYREFKYALLGTVVEAKVTEVYDEKIRGRFGRDLGSRALMDYEFVDKATNRRKDTVALSDDLARTVLEKQGKLQIIYLGGKDGSSRPVGQVSWLWLLIFFASLIGVVFFAWKMHKESSEDAKKWAKLRGSR
jgi:hypothetical protein